MTSTTAETLPRCDRCGICHLPPGQLPHGPETCEGCGRTHTGWWLHMDEHGCPLPITAEDQLITVDEAVEVLFHWRHTLTPDLLRSLQNIYLCASAARYGAPHETDWVEDPEF